LCYTKSQLAGLFRRKMRWRGQRRQNGRTQSHDFHAAASPVGSPWMWTLTFDYHEDRSPTYGYEATREAAHGGVREKLAARMIVRLPTQLDLPPCFAHAVC
jgi:hypothetical protein